MLARHAVTLSLRDCTLLNIVAASNDQRPQSISCSLVQQNASQPNGVGTPISSKEGSDTSDRNITDASGDTLQPQAPKHDSQLYEIKRFRLFNSYHGACVNVSSEQCTWQTHATPRTLCVGSVVNHRSWLSRGDETCIERSHLLSIEAYSNYSSIQSDVSSLSSHSCTCRRESWDDRCRHRHHWSSDDVAINIQERQMMSPLICKSVRWCRHRHRQRLKEHCSMRISLFYITLFAMVPQ